ncbi:hypothetical protein EOPP23_00315 [Endozoicomonas sp. OPT23]|uniref:hypothetical protein n=1 Tax=Endozoicomonas sp. OPT23 TaxID=2072845 RepID=UPI00129B1B3C|nr:hypothetical protein [Endozoicomonas sp. OPT23]MRI31432.1 hypothetical protein [Endozoicomonas sp. OPT23]
MFTIDDPMLALIIRFVAHQSDFDVSQEVFLQQQLEILQNHVSKFPVEQQEAKAMEWVELYARNYRRNWERHLATGQISHIQCQDCPLKGTGDESLCAIHGKWLKLLEDYCNEKVSTSLYVQHSLKLLQENKEKLKLARKLPRKAVI